jgi:S1-C subfamily serine protease
MGALHSLSNELAAAAERAGRSIVSVHARRRLPSTGTQWRPGSIVTADHTVRVDEDITVVLPGNRTVPARLAGRDPSTDIALLAVEESLPVAEQADPASVRIGHVVLALGPGPSVSWGVVSMLGSGWRTWRGGEVDRLIRPDLTFYPGFSGGPLVDTEGRVLGMNTSGLSRQLRLTVPGSTVDRVVDELLRSGRVSQGYLGIATQSVRLPDALRNRLAPDQDTGVIVLNVAPDSPASRAGLVIGDVLVALGGAPTADPGDVLAALGPARVGTAIAVSIIRAGQPITLEVRIEERPRGSR